MNPTDALSTLVDEVAEYIRDAKESGALEALDNLAEVLFELAFAARVARREAEAPDKVPVRGSEERLRRVASEAALLDGGPFLTEDEVLHSVWSIR